MALGDGAIISEVHAASIFRVEEAECTSETPLAAFLTTMWYKTLGTELHQEQVKDIPAYWID
jgi:hypothetical protein